MDFVAVDAAADFVRLLGVIPVVRNRIGGPTDMYAFRVEFGLMFGCCPYAPAGTPCCTVAPGSLRSFSEG